MEAQIAGTLEALVKTPEADSAASLLVAQVSVALNTLTPTQLAAIAERGVTASDMLTHISKRTLERALERVLAGTE
ncbi:hypothetical protein SEA_GINGERBUG_39 [Microbacterium phage Gingerbug]|nr:hypothetical protein SEA_GINGERBUG_39 [Microbacterium phage Gingerbug]